VAADDFDTIKFGFLQSPGCFAVLSSLIISPIFPFGMHPVQSPAFAGGPKNTYNSVGQQRWKCGSFPGGIQQPALPNTS
jgi:hypothetical protein